ncbi:MAG: hypothetical protein JWM98_805 [Thermoleophilia bacterium]|nr:hypothetical protein [Thermoleophilia bacterium]
METNLIFTLVAILAGALSVLTPCVLVMLPVILAVSGGEGRRRVIGVIVGLETSFIGISLLAAAALDALGLPPRTQEIAAVVIIAALGITLLVPALNHRFELLTSQTISRMPGLTGRAASGDGLVGGFLGGLGLGLVWAPCAGPILAFVTAAANTGEFSSRSVLVAFGFGFGMLGPLLLVFKGGHRMVGRLRAKFGARRLDVVMGSAMVVTAAFILFGGFTSINREIARLNLNSTPLSGLQQDAIERTRKDDIARVREQHGTTGTDAAPSQEELEIAGYPESEDGKLSNLGPAPALTGIGHEYNLPKGQRLDAAYLKGKVVVYDFWTYSCINCIRTLPYLRELNDRYAKDGLVIVGVHAPEFAFEKDERNVHQALGDLDVTWPVATDPDLRTWGAFHNHYWPAKYITDRDGQIRYVHVGEGGYDTTEGVIRTLLHAKGAAAPLPTEQQVQSNSPETYVGSGRLAQAQWNSHVVGGTLPVAAGPADYELGIGGAAPLPVNGYGVTGHWNIEPERATALGPDSELSFHYQSRNVYLVLDPGAHPGGTVTIHDSASVGGGTRSVEVTTDKLYTLRAGKQPMDGTIRLEVPAGVSAYAFTFG